ncbi:TPA: hypothetical protein RHX62_005142, partial [Escherichia coli]|nr:hypothetical protein [Escherichia coli]HDV1220286.1 hypothetical protein [Escherichia coli]HDV1283488.1 hypothetical protein [Escherichia coli]HDV1321672.1 hypothetical protein [Escherichia coli]HDV2136902.1 hypothetical protein [Escherichia coli]
IAHVPQENATLTARFMVLSGGQQKLWVINVVLRTPGQMNQEHLFAQLVLFV